jgi:hypothetical protein
MPITEVVRVIATAVGLDAEGREVRVDLRVDTDGSFGNDADALGFPAFWIAAGGELIGPFEHEDDAVLVAQDRFRARFD